MSVNTVTNVVHTFPSSVISSSATTPQIKLTREVAEQVHASFPLVTASVSEATLSPQGTVWLHVHVNRSPVKAWADAWTTVAQDENSTRVNVGSLCLRLEWASTEDSCVSNASEHHQWEWATFGAFKKAKATAWTKGPDIGPTVVETTI